MAPSIWRRPGTRTFQLVHRSQRDPLINDPTASDRVLKAIDKGQKRGKDGASSYAPSEMGDLVSEADDAEAAAGDAAAYGILFDDADEYDYMQHLRSVGGAADAYLVEAPVQGKQQGKGKGKAAAGGGGGFELNEAALAAAQAQAQRERFQLSEDALPSHPLDELSYTDVTTGKADETGLRPDLNPSIREVLEALDDDAYAADDGTGTDDEDAFWNGVMEGGVVEDLDEQEWSDEDDGVEQAAKGVKKLALQGEEEEDGEEAEGSWAAVKRFKAAQGGAADGGSDDDEDYDSEGGDTIADLKASIAKRPARRGAPSAVGSAFSMSSSAMFRNDQLRTLDDRFDQIEKMYNDSDDDSWGGSDEEVDSDGEPVGGEYHGPPREDLEQIMDDFLSRFEVIGGKMKPVLDPLHVPDLVDSSEAGAVAANASKLDRLRQALANVDLGAEVEGEDPELTARRREKERILAIVERQWNEETSRKKKDRMPMIHILEDERKDRWDCETVLSTYSNLSNHPRMLRLRDSMGKKKKSPSSDASSTPVAQIKIDSKTGFPTVNGESVLDARPNARRQKEEDTIMEEDEEDEEEYEIRETVKRPRDETTSDKKARKAAVKAERALRRAEKKSTKETFSSEVKRQKRAQGRRLAEGGAADIRSGQEGVKRLA